MNILVLGVHYMLGSIAYFAVVTTSEVWPLKHYKCEVLEVG
jgi:hypothetical protein